MRVSFDGGRINERGVAVAIFDYAFYARALLGVEPIILHDSRDPPEPAQLERFRLDHLGDERHVELVARAMTADYDGAIAVGSAARIGRGLFARDRRESRGY